MKLIDKLLAQAGGTDYHYALGIISREGAGWQLIAYLLDGRHRNDDDIVLPLVHSYEDIEEAQAAFRALVEQYPSLKEITTIIDDIPEDGTGSGVDGSTNTA